jgi:prepilin-type N-terminal cleavage/methylation domain-containing protein
VTTDVHTNTRRRQGGFTLVEVLIALVILAVGLLALEALGIGAARLVNKAQRQSQYVQIATSELELTVAQLRDTTLAVPGGANRAVPGANLTRTVTNVGDLYTVTVTVVPTRSTALVSPADSVRLSANVFRP